MQHEGTAPPQAGRRSKPLQDGETEGGGVMERGDGAKIGVFGVFFVG